MKISVRDRENYLKNMESADAIEPGTITIAQEMRNDKKPDFCFMKEGDIFNLGDKELEIIEMPGHTAGSVCILDRKDKVLFSGDNVNDIELLCAPAQDRWRLLEDWHCIGERIFSQKDAFEICGGGHGLISIEKALDTLDCGKKILKGKIQAEKQKIHFTDIKRYTCTTALLMNYITEGELKKVNLELLVSSNALM